MKAWMLSELKDVLQCEIPVEAEITCVSTDTRSLPQGCLFVALRGERFDGHDFVPQAIAAGAVAAVTEQPIEGCPCLVVENTGRALLKIARFYREKFHPVLVGVTGSVGKTTTKEMIACVLESQFCTLKTQGNLNNEIGLPKTLMQLEEQHTAAVIEMGMSHFGEISRLSRTAEPSMGVITNIGYSHIENLKTQEGILQAKLEILDGMAADAPLIVNGDNALLAPLKRNLPRPVITYGMHAEKLDVRAEDVVRNADSTTFTIAAADGKKYPAMLRCVGDHNVMNALAAFCVGTQAGIAPEKICAALERYQTVGMRQNISHRGAYTIIADCYNASPDSMKASIDVLCDMDCEGKKIAVLGDMFELGADSASYHYQIGEYLRDKKIDEVVVVGKEALEIKKALDVCDTKYAKTFSFMDNEEVALYLMAIMRPEDVVLIKGSHGMKMDEIVKILTN